MPEHRRRFFAIAGSDSSVPDEQPLNLRHRLPDQLMKSIRSGRCCHSRLTIVRRASVVGQIIQIEKLRRYQRRPCSRSTLRSCLTLPGQSNASSRRRAAVEIPRIVF